MVAAAGLERTRLATPAPTSNIISAMLVSNPKINNAAQRQPKAALVAAMVRVAGPGDATSAVQANKNDGKSCTELSVPGTE